MCDSSSLPPPIVIVGAINDGRSFTAPPDLVGRNCAGIALDNFAGVLYGGIGGNLTGELSFAQSGSASRVARFDVGGTISAPIHSASAEPNGLIVRAGAIEFVSTAPSTAREIKVTDGRIKEIRALGGNGTSGSILNAIIEATNGDRIEAVVAANNLLAIVRTDTSATASVLQVSAAGNVGVSPTQRSLIRCRGSVGLVEGDNLWVDVFAGADGSDGYVGRIDAREGILSGNVLGRGTAAVAGVAVPGIFAAGDLQGIIDVREQGITTPIIIGGSTLSGSMIKTTGALAGNANISIGGSHIGAIAIGQATGLQRQIIIGASGTGGSWTGPVTLNGIALSPRPTYAGASSLYGGSAVGLSRFFLYTADCVPISNSPLPIELNSTNGLINPILIQYYGPIKASAATGSPVKIERRVNFNNGEVWVDVTSGFDIAVGGQPGAPTMKRELRISGDGPYPAGSYRVTPNTTGTRLVCDEVTGEPNVQSGVYNFALCQMPGEPPPPQGNCVADFDDGSGTGTPDGGVTIEDLLHYLTIFDQGNVAADIDNGSFCNIHDGGVTIDDLLYFLYRFDNGC